MEHKVVVLQEWIMSFVVVVFSPVTLIIIAFMGALYILSLLLGFTIVRLISALGAAILVYGGIFMIFFWIFGVLDDIMHFRTIENNKKYLVWIAAVLASSVSLFIGYMQYLGRNPRRGMRR
jgi:hypothetical protein